MTHSYDISQAVLGRPLSVADQIAHLAIILPSKKGDAWNVEQIALFRNGHIRRIYVLFVNPNLAAVPVLISRLKDTLKVPNAVYSVKSSKRTKALISVSWPSETTGSQKERPSSATGQDDSK
jgi:hypothetical protein